MSHVPQPPHWEPTFGPVRSMHSVEVEQSSRAHVVDHNSTYSILRSGPRVIPQSNDPFTISGYEPWMEEANCLDVDPEIFYPNKGAQRKCKAAKRICDACPVKQQCLEYAIRIHEWWGIWGGLTSTERRKVKL